MTRARGCALQGGVTAPASQEQRATTSSSAAAATVTVQAQQGRLMEEANQLAMHIIPTVLRELLVVQEATASDQSYVVTLEAEVRRLGCAMDHVSQSLQLTQAVGEELRGKLDAAMDRELRSLDRELDLRTCNLVSEEELQHTKHALAKYDPPPPRFNSVG